VNAKLDGLKGAADTYTRWQVLFGQISEAPKEGNPKVTAVLKAVDARTRLWKGLDAWNARHAAWTLEPFAGVDVEEVAREVQVAAKASYGFEKTIGDGVSALYKAKVSAFRAYVGVIVDLGNKALRERHWARIYKEFGAEYSAEGGEARTLSDPKFVLLVDDNQPQVVHQRVVM
jgi:hypothetical protein